MNYYDEVNSYVKKVEIGKAIRETNANMELVECYWNVGRLIVEAQGGKEKAKYGNELLKIWAEKLIYSQLSYVFLQLGKGFTWVGNQYKVSDGNKNYFIDMLLYNVKYNCYVVVEIKCRKLKKEDKGQVEFYMNLVDNYVKEPSNNPTIGIIITKDQDKFVANFVRSEKVVPLTYELVK